MNHELGYLQYTTNNKNEIEKSGNCFCVYCEKVYPSNEVTEYLETEGECTALCPHCGVDPVIPDSLVK